MDRLPASRVHEDDSCLALMDIHPLGHGHVLVIPKRHAVQLTELRPEESRHLFTIGNRILHAQRSLGWDVQGSHILLNDGPAANQLVPHVHLHIIPREPRDTLRTLGKLALHLSGLIGPAPSMTAYEKSIQFRTWPRPSVPRHAGLCSAP